MIVCFLYDHSYAAINVRTCRRRDSSMVMIGKDRPSRKKPMVVRATLFWALSAVLPKCARLLQLVSAKPKIPARFLFRLLVQAHGSTFSEVTKIHAVVSARPCSSEESKKTRRHSARQALQASRINRFDQSSYRIFQQGFKLLKSARNIIC